MTFAGTPATIANGGTSRVTTAPAATTAPRPIVTPGRTVTRDAIHTWSSMVTVAARVPCFASLGSCSNVHMRMRANIGVLTNSNLTFAPVKDAVRIDHRPCAEMHVRGLHESHIHGYETTRPSCPEHSREKPASHAARWQSTYPQVPCNYQQTAGHDLALFATHRAQALGSARPHSVA